MQVAQKRRLTLVALGLGAMMPLWFLQPVGAQFDDRAVDKATIERELRAAIQDARDDAELRQVQFDRPATDAIDKMIRTATERLFKDRAGKEKVANAKGRLTTIIRIAAKENNGRVTTERLQEVTNWLCPGFWPFC